MQTGWAEWIGVISGALAILAFLSVAVTKGLIPYVAKRLDDPIDPATPLTRDALTYQDAGRAVALLEKALRAKEPDIVVGIDIGGATLAGILAKRLHIPVRLVHRISMKNEYACACDMSEFDGKVVLLVDDACRTGGSMRAAAAFIKSKSKPKEVVTAALLATVAPHARTKLPTPSSAVNVYAYHSHRTDIRMPWD